MYNYNYLVDRLKESVITVTFTKVDGSERTMTCTLLPNYLPEQYRNNAPILSEEVGNVISAWDVNAGGWRSFRIDSVKSVR